MDYQPTGIKNRHIAKNETTAELVALAAQRAIENSKIDKNEIGLIIVATFTPDYLTPSIACLVQSKLGLNETVCLCAAIKSLWWDLAAGLLGVVCCWNGKHYIYNEV